MLENVQVLGCGVAEHESTIARLQAERRQLAKDNKALSEQAAKGVGLALAASLPPEVGPAASY